MVAGTDNAYRLVSKHGARVGFGTDILFDPRIAPRRGPCCWLCPALFRGALGRGQRRCRSPVSEVKGEVGRRQCSGE